MEVKIQAIHFEAGEKLQEFINKKVGKFGKLIDEIRKVDVQLKLVKPETSLNKEVSIKVLASNGEFFAEKVCDTFEEAVDLCLDALARQVLKFKEKQKNR